uniref:Uncharacterized protein n=1 Tax=Lactuca sativa TaxID=4236 RepID=A0A9R1X779_LACSA|nr:hypothetical protein LSAT_V11C600302320 [Lactuca sativa]
MLIHPKGVVEDVFVQVIELVLPSDFYVLDMGDDDSPNSSSILLGIPFLKTTKTKIDVYNGTLSMNLMGRYPSDVQSLNFIDIVRPLTGKCFELTNHEFLELVLSRNFEKNSVKEIAKKFKLDDKLLGIVEFMNDKKNIEFNEMGTHRKLKFQKLEEFQNEAFENSHIYKDKTETFQNKYLSLTLRWVRPFIVTNVYDHGAVEIKSKKTGKVFKVNGHNLKVFYEGFQEKDMEVDSLKCLDYIT